MISLFTMKSDFGLRIRARGYSGFCFGRVSLKDGRRELCAAMADMKTLSLLKGADHFCFRYEVGQEAKVLDALIESVNRRDLAFDWFDAAVLSHQLGQHLAKELKACLPKKVA
jgi:hypothetical protein